MNYYGEVLELLTTEEAKEYADVIKKPLPEFKKHLTLLVEDSNMVIMKNIGYNQYQIENIYIDKRSK